MALLSTQVLPDNTLEEFRIEFNKLVTDVSGLSLGNTFDTQIIFEGTTDDTFETGISVTDPTADRSIVFPDQSGNVLLDSANINLADSIELQFGTGSDLKIYHDGSHSYIDDAGTGSLLIRSNQIELKKQSSDEKMATFAEDGAITLYHNNVEILATAATGISVAGDVTATDDLNLTSDAAVLSFGENSEVTLTHVHNDGLLLNADNQLQFRDNAINIRSPADGDLDINADDEIELNSTLVDLNANLDVSGTYTGAGLMTTGGNIIIPNGGNIGSVGDTDAIAISSAGVVTFSATPVFGGDSTFADDVSLLSDAAVLSFGADSEVTLTHVHNDGLLLNTDMQLQFRDSAINIRSDADGDLDINADDEIELNSTLIDINGNVEISGTATTTGVHTFTVDALVNGLTVGRGLAGVATNTVLGASALDANTSGSLNTAVGLSALSANTEGAQNVAVGRNAALATTTAVANTAIGTSALSGAITTGGGTAVGGDALKVTTGTNNTAIGYGAGETLTTGTNNTLVGFNADPSAVDVSNEITLGDTNVTKVRMGNGKLFAQAGLPVGVTHLGTMTTTSGTSHQVSGIDFSSLNFIYFNVAQVSHSDSSAGRKIQFSIAGGAGLAVGDAVAHGNAIVGQYIMDLRSNIGSFQFSPGNSAITSGYDFVSGGTGHPRYNMAVNLQAATNAACSVSWENGSTFDGGSVELYGVK